MLNDTVDPQKTENVLISTLKRSNVVPLVLLSFCLNFRSAICNKTTVNSAV